MAQSPIDGGVVLLTGASSGIGLEFARQVAGRARKLIVVARRVEKLEELKNDLVSLHPKLEVQVEKCDLSDLVATRALAAKVLAEAEVDVLINNAGIGDMGVFERANVERLVSMIDLNVTSLVLLTHAFVGPMVARGRGGILNVSSGAGMSYMPGFAVYTGTKHFVTGFTETLSVDLAGTGVHVTQLCPGPVPTEFEKTAGNFTGQSPPKLIEVTAAHCARVALRALDANRAMVIPGFIINLLLLMSKYTPRWLVRALARPVGKALRKKQLATT